MRVMPMLVLLTTSAAAAQEPAAGMRFGLLGFGARAGVDLEGEADLVLGYTLDVADLYREQLRLRPSVEIGLQSGAGDTYVGNLEIIYRFTGDTVIAVPYVGAGLALQGHDACSRDPSCPSLWAQFVLGFELAFRPTFNWLMEYHAEDAFRRHRLFVGLVTRRMP